MFKNSIILLSCLTLSAVSLAQKAIGEDIVQVELVFFQTEKIDETITDRLLELPPPDYESLMRSAFNLYSTASSTIKPQAIRTTPSTLLPEEFKRLQKQSDFDVIFHASWVQPAYAPGQNVIVQVTPGRQKSIMRAQANIFYEGLYKLNLNILYDTGHTLLSDSVPQAKPLFIPLEIIMAEDKTYYLDHPLLGVLARLSLIKH